MLKIHFVTISLRGHRGEEHSAATFWSATPEARQAEWLPGRQEHTHMHAHARCMLNMCGGLCGKWPDSLKIFFLLLLRPSCLSSYPPSSSSTYFLREKDLRCLFNNNLSGCAECRAQNPWGQRHLSCWLKALQPNVRSIPPFHPSAPRLRLWLLLRAMGGGGVAGLECVGASTNWSEFALGPFYPERGMEWIHFSAGDVLRCRRQLAEHGGVGGVRLMSSQCFKQALFL